VDSASSQIYVCKKKSNGEIEREMRCVFDRVFSQDTSQAEVFEYVQDSVQQVTQGYNCTVFAYGQTGTGKTHTMLSVASWNVLVLVRGC
jgi:DNA replication protein DnaC